MARLLFKGEDPIGRSIHVSLTPPDSTLEQDRPREIVGSSRTRRCASGSSVTPMDPATLASVALVLVAVAAVACYIPSRRASTADPLETLRAQ